MREKVYRDYIQDILTSLEEVEEFIHGLSFEEFTTTAASRKPRPSTGGDEGAAPDEVGSSTAT